MLSDVALSLFWIVALVGITAIIVYGSIFGPLRKFIADRSDVAYEMVSCGQCMGFWVGWIGSVVLHNARMPGAYFQISALQCLIASVCVGAVVSLISTLVSRTIER